MGKEKAGFRPLLPVKAPGQCPRTLCEDTKDAILPARPSNSTREEFLNAPSGRLCEKEPDSRGLEEMCARADVMRRESWGDMEAWLIENLGLYAPLPDSKRIPEDLKAKMLVRINTQSV